MRLEGTLEAECGCRMLPCSPPPDILVPCSNHPTVYEVPPAIKEGLDRYEKEGIRPGRFLQAVLENDLTEALGRADSYNRRAVFEIFSYIYNELPHICHGSPQKVADWIDVHEERRARARGESARTEGKGGAV